MVLSEGYALENSAFENGDDILKYSNLGLDHWPSEVSVTSPREPLHWSTGQPSHALRHFESFRLFAKAGQFDDVRSTAQQIREPYCQTGALCDVLRAEFRAGQKDNAKSLGAAERRLRVLSPQISSSVIPKLYGIRFVASIGSPSVRGLGRFRSRTAHLGRRCVVSPCTHDPEWGPGA
jgi:hypothetical protein